MEDLEKQVFKSQESTETGQEGHTDEVMLTEDSVWHSVCGSAFLIAGGSCYILLSLSAVLG